MRSTCSQMLCVLRKRGSNVNNPNEVERDIAKHEQEIAAAEYRCARVLFGDPDLHSDNGARAAYVIVAQARAAAMSWITRGKMGVE